MLGLLFGNIRLLFLLAILLHLAGCSFSSSPRFNFDKDKAISGADREHLLALLSGKSKEVESFKTLARTTIQRKDERHRFRYLFVLQHPTNIHLEVLPISGGYALSLLKSNGSNILFLDIGSKTAYTDTIQEGTIEKLIMLPLEAGHILPLLSGRVPVNSIDGKKRSTTLYRNQDGTSITLVVGNFHEIYIFDANTLLLREMIIRDIYRNKDIMNVKYGDYKNDSGGSLYPESLAITLDKSNTKIGLTLGLVSINSELADNLFTQDIPAGFTIESIQ